MCLQIMYMYKEDAILRTGAAVENARAYQSVKMSRT